MTKALDDPGGTPRRRSRWSQWLPVPRPRGKELLHSEGERVPCDGTYWRQPQRHCHVAQSRARRHEAQSRCHKRVPLRLRMHDLSTSAFAANEAY